MSEGSKSNRRNAYKIRDQGPERVNGTPDAQVFRPMIEPWLTALFQSEHLSLLLGSGISSAARFLADTNSSVAGTEMKPMQFTTYREQIEQSMVESASRLGRGEPNIEDQIRVCNELIRGLKIYTSVEFLGQKKMKRNLKKVEDELEGILGNFANQVLGCERDIIQSDSSVQAAEYLMSFLISFASRSSTRERLNIFTTNYDRIIEYGCELAGIHLIDRFVGTINPIFRSSRLDIDIHYNPPGIRGEPRYLEGVAKFSKLHGSLDWSMEDRIVRRYALPYGAKDVTKYLDRECKSLLIYPNAVKDKETSEYPYVELFRDFAVSVCQPNSTLVVYGYSFGDDHINRIIADMLTIPSAHLVIISFDDQGNRIRKFYDQVQRPAQISLLLGDHFGDLKTLVDSYLPKPAIDRTTIRMVDLLKGRGITGERDNKDQYEAEGEDESEYEHEGEDEGEGEYEYEGEGEDEDDEEGV